MDNPMDDLCHVSGCIRNPWMFPGSRGRNVRGINGPWFFISGPMYEIDWPRQGMGGLDSRIVSLSCGRS